jgi:hypothetical protein
VRLDVPVSGAGLAAGFDDRAGALAWLEEERANLVAATRFAADGRMPAMAWLSADVTAPAASK